MNLSECYYLGYISRVIEARGQLDIKLDVDDPQEYKNLESVLVQLHKGDQSPIPFFIAGVKSIQGAVIRIQIKTEESPFPITNLKGKAVYMPLSKLKKRKGKAFYYHEIIDFEVRDSIFGIVGSVVEVYDLPVNPIISVLSGNKEVLIPINDDIILSVNREEKYIEIKAPEGLIELYLG
ncbi:MAG: ribosome maturation factor RimM [Vicingaceae bacterium]